MTSFKIGPCLKGGLHLCSFELIPSRELPSISLSHHKRGFEQSPEEIFPKIKKNEKINNWFHYRKYGGDLKSGLVWIFNGQKEVGLQMVWISNGM